MVKKRNLIKLLAGAFLISNFGLISNVASAASNSNNVGFTTEDVVNSNQGTNSSTTNKETQNLTWAYPFASQKKNGVRPMYKAQTFGMTDYARSLSPLSYFHDGWDFGFSEVGHSTVKAIHPGTVKEVRQAPGLGWYVWVISPDKYVEIYQEGFNSRKDITVKPGQKIKTGQKIGKLTGSHLHLGVTKTNHKYINQHGYPCNNWYRDVGTWLNPVKVIEDNMNK